MALRIESDAEPIPGYRLLERLGGGGFGEVWKAIAPGGLHKAVKIIHGNLQSKEEEGSRLAAQELRAIKRVQGIRHPYLLSLERYDIIEGRLLIVSELADCNLWDTFRECRAKGLPGIPRADLLQYMTETAEVLDMMNGQHALQHLDIKPQNLFLLYNHVKVADFGLVKDLEGMRAEVTGGVTPVYAAPETFDGVVTRFCDQYSLAIVYQELLTGVRPFNGTTAQQLLMQHLQGTPNVSPLPAAERAIVARALAKKPEDRFPTCLQFIKAIQHLGGGSTSNSAYPSPAARVDTPAERQIPARLESAMPPPETPRTEFHLRQEPAAMASVSVEFLPQRVAPPEFLGDGEISPTIVIGLGQTGLVTLQRLRNELCEAIAPVEKIPSLRLTYIDTDPESVQELHRKDHRSPLHADEIIITKLNRAAHYLKPRRNGRSLIEGWCDPQLLYRIPRNPETQGIRSLGRLAFLDHYRSIAGKFREDLEAACHPDSLAATCRQTGLSLRSNRPKVYIVCHLAGGTGSGMFLDMAYTARLKMRQLGYLNPEIIGLFLVPGMDRINSRNANHLSNTYAALRELNHFSLPETVFDTQYDERDGRVNDSASPFSRIVVLPTPSTGEKNQPPRVDDGVKPLVQMLKRDLFSPFGRRLDEIRNELPKKSGFDLTVQSFAVETFAWPRQGILSQTGRWLADTLLLRWVTADANHLKSHVKNWLIERWTQDEAGPEFLIARLQKACEKELGFVPDTLFTEEASQYIPKGWFSREPDSAKLWASLGKVQHIVGMPDERAMQRQAGQIEALLLKQMEIVARDLGAKVCKIPQVLLEHPDYRISGAEEAIDQMTAMLQQLVQQYETLSNDLGDKASDAFYYIHYFLSGEQGRKRPSVAEVAEHLKLYPKWRYQSLILRSVARLYAGVLVQLADLKREMGYCREKLEDLIMKYRKRPNEQPRDCAHVLLPAGCESFDEAVRSLRKSITPEDLREVDQQIQSYIEAEFQALFSVCLSSMNLMGNLEQTIDRQARTFLQTRLPEPEFAEMFLQKAGSPAAAVQLLEASFERVQPPIARTGLNDVAKITVIGFPPGSNGEWFETLSRQACSSESVRLLPQADEILIYREYARFPLTDLPQLGPIAEDAYTAALGNSSCPPHTRTDIPTWSDLEVM
jgi:serine/threonine protein kinase